MGTDLLDSDERQVDCTRILTDFLHVLEHWVFDRHCNTINPHTNRRHARVLVATGKQFLCSST